MKHCIVLLPLVFLFNKEVLLAQTYSNLSLEFRPIMGNSHLRINAFYKISNEDSIKFETLKFYISGVELLNDQKTIWKQENSYHLIDATEDKTLHLDLKIPAYTEFNQLQFNIGIDSSTNVSGAMGGDLDPTKGMYWTWQSGYINFKLEGKCNRSKTRNNEFQFHLGGYQYPFNSLQRVLLNIQSPEKITVNIDLEKFIATVDFVHQNAIMSPSNEAVLLSEKVVKIFSIK